MQKNKNFIKEIFENFGHIFLDTVDPNDKSFRSWLKKHFITIKSHGPGAGGGWDDVEYTGTYSSLLKMVENFFDEDEEFVKEYYEKLR